MSASADLFLARMAQPAPQELMVAGQRLRAGSRVRLTPRPGGDVLDTVLAGRAAVIEGFDEDDEGHPRIAVTLEDDPGQDLGQARNPAHRFFFAPDEVVPDRAGETAPRRVLVAGLGNIFLGDDGFGVAVVEALAARELPPDVEVTDFGIRGMDLAYALGRPYGAAILVDALPRGKAAGTLCVIEPDGHADASAVPDGHHMDPLTVLRLARRLGPLPPRVLVVGCEPGAEADEDTMSMRLSAPVAAAVATAADMVLELAHGLRGEAVPAERAAGVA
jgi:hydrogenase maturation protease